MENKLDIKLIITIASIILSAGTTIGYIKATMGNMDSRITTLTTKVEQHNNFGLRLVELETKVRMLEQHLDRRHK